MSVTAFAPGSVTTLFVPQDEDASLGVSFAVADGVTATVEPSDATAVHLDGAPTEVAPVAGVLQRLDATATVHLTSDLPIGCGFGVSGAATLATALAANEALHLGHDRAALLKASHRAEVAAGTGLGDVFIQERGGLVWNVGHGMQHAERTTRIEYASYGEISTADVLGDADAMTRVAEAGTRALAAVDPTGPFAALFDVSWTFATDAGVPTDAVRRAVSAVRAAGGAATMAMIGNTVVATGAEGTLPHATQITRDGAALL